MRSTKRSRVQSWLTSDPVIVGIPFRSPTNYEVRVAFTIYVQNGGDPSMSFDVPLQRRFVSHQGGYLSEIGRGTITAVARLVVSDHGPQHPVWSTRNVFSVVVVGGS